MQNVRGRAAAAALVIMLAAAGFVWVDGAGAQQLGVQQGPARVVSGESVQVGGSEVSAWAAYDDSGRLAQVGVNVGYGLFAKPPAEPGQGPAGAIAVVGFPDAVKSDSFFDHFEMQWEPHGHEPKVFEVPHFDLHFYGIPVGEVAATGPSDPQAPDPSRLPEGWVYAGQAESVPQMGVHALNPADLSKPFTAVMILGYYGGTMRFLEPMVTQQYLSRKQDFSLDVPAPRDLGRQTLYPTRFTAHYDAATDSYRFTFEDFTELE